MPRRSPVPGRYFAAIPLFAAPRDLGNAGAGASAWKKGAGEFLLHIGMRVSAGVAAVAMGFAVGLGTQGIGPAYAGLGMVLSGISTVAISA